MAIYEGIKKPTGTIEELKPSKQLIRQIMIRKFLFGAIRIIKYVVACIVFTITIIFLFTYGVIWLGETSGGFAP